MENSKKRPLAAPVVFVCTAAAIISVAMVLSLSASVSVPTVLLALGVMGGLAVTLKSFHSETSASQRKELVVIGLAALTGLGVSGLLFL